MSETPYGSSHLTAEMHRGGAAQPTIVRRGMVQAGGLFLAVEVSSGFDSRGLWPWCVPTSLRGDRLGP